MMNPRIEFVLASLCASFLLAGCATADNRLVSCEQGQLTEQRLADVLRANPLGADQSIRVTLLRKTDHASVHLVQVGDGERPHVHQTHDLTVFILRGRGDMVIGTESRPVREGEVIHVPAGTRHYFTNRGREPAVAAVVFGPPFDGKDKVEVD